MEPIENNKTEIIINKKANKTFKACIISIIITFLITAIAFSTIFISSTIKTMNYLKNDLGIDISHIMKVASICNEVGIKENPGEASVTDNMLLGYVSAFKDKYSMYVPRDLATNYEIATDSSYTGMGITYTKKLNEENQYYEISEVSPNTPAERAGLKVGDKIYAINGIEIANEEEITKTLTELKSGKIKEVKIIINNNQEVIVKIEKIEIPVTDFKIENDIAKLSIFTFAERTSKEVIEHINNAEEANVKGYLIDLRDNTGGSKDAAIEILERFVKEGTLIKETDKNKTIKASTKAKDNKFIDKPIVLLINENTASASELISMALQDLNNAKTVGQTSFGKSTILTSLTFRNGSSIVVSSGYYLPESERYIEDIGITPDYETEIGEEETKGLEVLNELIKG